MFLIILRTIISALRSHRELALENLALCHKCGPKYGEPENILVINSVYNKNPCLSKGNTLKTFSQIRLFVSFLSILVIPVCIRSQTPDYWPTEGWRSSAPEEQGMDSEKLADMIESIQKNVTCPHSLHHSES
jgi:hypothetical protein